MSSYLLARCCCNILSIGILWKKSLAHKKNLGKSILTCSKTDRIFTNLYNAGLNEDQFHSKQTLFLPYKAAYLSRQFSEQTLLLEVKYQETHHFLFSPESICFTSLKNFTINSQIICLFLESLGMRFIFRKINQSKKKSTCAVLNVQVDFSIKMNFLFVLAIL